MNTRLVVIAALLLFQTASAQNPGRDRGAPVAAGA